MKRILLFIALQLPLGSTHAAPVLPQERVWVDLTIMEAGGYDESLQRTHVVSSAADGDELLRLAVAQSKLVTIQRMQIVRQRNGAVTAQVLVDAKQRAASQPLTGVAVERALSDLKAGDIVDYAVHVHHPQLLPEHQRSLHYSLRRHEVFGDGRVSVHVPKSSSLIVTAGGFDHQAVHSSEAGLTYTYAVRNDTPVPEEAGAANTELTAPTLRASTFRDYGALATLIRNEFTKALVPSTTLDQVAAKIAAENHDPRAAALASYRWVQQNIGYDAQAMDANGITPHTLAEIVANKHGDCKDHVVVLQALLKAQGLGSIPALINTQNQYQLSALPVVADFNHVITYIPSFDLYVDATDKYARFGSLPLNRQDKPVLLLTKEGRQARTPLTGNNSSVTDAHYRVDQGKMSVLSRTISTGDSALETALARDAMRGRDLNALLHRSLTARGLDTPQGSMSFAGDMERMNFTMNFSALLPASEHHRAAIALNPFFNNRSTLAAIALNFLPERRNNSFLCPPRTIIERYTVEVPLASKATLPPAVDFQVDELSYQATYAQHGNSIAVQRQYVNASKQGACEASAYLRYHQLAQRVAADIYTQIQFTWP